MVTPKCASAALSRTTQSGVCLEFLAIASRSTFWGGGGGGGSTDIDNNLVNFWGRRGEEKFQGVPTSVCNSDTKQYAYAFFQALLLKVLPMQLIIYL